MLLLEASGVSYIAWLSSCEGAYLGGRDSVQIILGCSNHILDSSVDACPKSRKATSGGLNRWASCWTACIPKNPGFRIVIVIIIRVIHKIIIDEIKDELQGAIGAIFKNFDNDRAHEWSW